MTDHYLDHYLGRSTAATAEIRLARSWFAQWNLWCAVVSETRTGFCSVQKLRRNRQLATLDIRWIEDVFIEFGLGTHQDIEQVATEHDGLGIYLRSLTGLDREAASAALDQFQRGKTYNASQLHFLALLTDVLASGGSEDIFLAAEVDAIVSVLRHVRSTAVPVADAA